MDDTRGSPAETTTDEWTSRRLLEWMTERFTEHGVDSPRLTAELLLACALDCERLRLYMEVDRPASPSELSRLRGMVRRVASHEPVQYVIGEGWFYGRAFNVSPLTLIPRPSTETLVEHVINDVRARGRAAPRIADVGTGTGCIAVTLALEIQGAVVVASDLDEEIIAAAKANAERHNAADSIEFRVGSLTAPLRHDEQFDYFCSNPPYISDAEWGDVPANVREFEPERALRGGVDGLDLIRPLIAEAAQYLSPGGQMVLEVAATHAPAAMELVSDEPRLRDPVIHRDYEDHPRVLVATRV